MIFEEKGYQTIPQSLQAHPTAAKRVCDQFLIDLFSENAANTKWFVSDVGSTGINNEKRISGNAIKSMVV
jgi:hypothetical protein